MNCQLNFAFNACRPKSGQIKTHKHDCYEVVLYTRGLGSTTINGKVSLIKTGTVALISPKSWHEEQHFEDTDVLCIGFNLEQSDLNFIEGVYSISNYKTFVRLTNDILKESLEQREHYKAMIAYKLGELIIEILRMHDYSDPKCKDLSYVVNFLRENYSQQINMMSLAQLCGYSYDYFRHLFKLKTGISPQTFIMEERIKSSLHLLKNTDMKIVDIAIVCGFSNSAQFSTIFKTKYKKTPNEFRHAKELK